MTQHTAPVDQKKADRKVWRWIWVPIAFAFIVGLFLIPGAAKESLNVAGEFNLEAVIKLPKLGPFDLSITKAVIYLWIATAVIVVFAIFVSRRVKMEPTRFGAIVEMLYSLAYDGITKSVMKNGAETWFPYIGAVFFFVLVNNLIGLIPLPSERTTSSRSTRLRPTST